MYVYIHRVFDDFQAKYTVCTPYIYGSGQPYVCGTGLTRTIYGVYTVLFAANQQFYGHVGFKHTVLANPTYRVTHKSWVVVNTLKNALRMLQAQGSGRC
jgi:hypothetical protein